MTKKVLLTNLLLAFGISVFAQGFYIKVGGGYTWPGFMRTSTIKGFEPYASNNISDLKKILDPAYANITDMSNIERRGYLDSTNVYHQTSASDKVVTGSYGEGGNLNFGVGYRINDWVGVDWAFSYLWGKTISSTQNRDDMTKTLGVGTSVVTKTHSYGLSMTPSLMLYGTKCGHKFTPYARLGIILPVWGATIHDITVNSPNSSLGTVDLKSVLQVKTESKVSVGFSGALGCMYNPFKFMSIYAEITSVNLTVRAKQSDLEKFTIDGTEKISGTTTHADRITGEGDLPSIMVALGSNNKALSKYSLVTEFSDNLNQDSNTELYGKLRDAAHSGEAGYVDETKARQTTKQSAPFDAFGFNIGVSFTLSKASLAKEEKGHFKKN